MTRTESEPDDDLWIGYTDFVTPFEVWHYDLASKEKRI